MSQLTLSEIGERLQHLMDCEAIRQAMYIYARGVDRVDEDLLAASYHPGAWDDHGSWSGDRETAIEGIMTRGRSGKAKASMHHIGNILIDLKGDYANVESYFVAYQVTEAGGKTFTRMRAGRYLDRFERRDGAWRVARRRVVDDWSRLDEVVAAAAEIGPNNTIGTRDATDASYGMEGFLANLKAG